MLQNLCTQPLTVGNLLGIGEKGFTRIKVKNSIVDLDGDEMTRYHWLRAPYPEALQAPLLLSYLEAMVLLAGLSGMTLRRRSAFRLASILLCVCTHTSLLWLSLYKLCQQQPDLLVTLSLQL